ncbi:MAG: hypothetical protein Ct9H90mP27_4340 [Gammaproteobacteria bacterium]|nr:MAG: hypothetical protein Ct9H90mP27_4340 [Gammaproteobacteria bacterium]
MPNVHCQRVSQASTGRQLVIGKSHSIQGYSQYPMSERAKSCQMVPKTFQGISRGIAKRTRITEAVQPVRGIPLAIMIPRGTSTIKMLI